MTSTAPRATWRDTTPAPGGTNQPTAQKPEPAGLTQDEIRQIVRDILG